MVGIALAAGCQHSAPQRSTGSVSGDVFLLMQNGDVKRGAGNTVLLLGPADSVIAKRGRICAVYGQELLAAARRGGTSPDVVGLLDTSLLRLTVASAKTGINAHYHFDHLPAGKYVLWAQTMIVDNSYTWWAPIVVTGRDSVSKDLDNSTEARAALYCGHDRDSLAPLVAHLEDSVANFATRQQQQERQQATRQRQQAWLRCMTQARAVLRADSGVITPDVVDRQRECWIKFPVDPEWAGHQNP
jgi:hypothetical protein